MLHKRCDQVILLLRTQLTDAQQALEQERRASREREDKLISMLTRIPEPIGLAMTRGPAPGRARLELSEDLPPELFDPDHSLYVGKDLVPPGWVPRDQRPKPQEPQPE